MTENDLIKEVIYKNKNNEELIFTDEVFDGFSIKLFETMISINNSKIIFKRCNFKDNIEIIDPNRQEGEIKIEIYDSNFEKKLIIGNTILINTLKLYSTTIESLVIDSHTKFYNLGLDNTKIKNIEIEDITVSNLLGLQNSSILNDIRISNCKINEIKAQNMHVENFFSFYKVRFDKLNLEGISYGKLSIFSLTNRDEKPLNYNNFDNFKSPQLLKYYFEDQKDVIEANKFYKIEKDCYMEELKSNKFFYSNQNLFAITLSKYLTNFRSDWILPLLWMNVALYLFPMLYGMMEYDNNEMLNFHFNKVLISYTVYFFILILVLYFLYLFRSILAEKLKDDDYKLRRIPWIIITSIIILWIIFIYFSLQKIGEINSISMIMNEPTFCVILLFILSIILLFSYRYKKNLMVYLILFIYILLFIFSDIAFTLSNNASTLINPFNMFKSNIKYFEHFVLFGMVIKFVYFVLSYQFLISFRQSTR